jgi:hypothetical protein
MTVPAPDEDLAALRARAEREHARAVYWALRAQVGHGCGDRCGCLGGEDLEVARRWWWKGWPLGANR